ncbi:MAG: hypothetical protein HYW48_03215 [Deltaproteobacteria bacterium]|nr:hypothetical protein [Deltaproteobacteria bacterium]
MSRSFFLCANGLANLDGMYITNKRFASLSRYKIKTSFHYGLKHTLFYQGYMEQMGGTGDELPFQRESRSELAIYQYGTPGSDRVLFRVGHGLLPFGINRTPLVGLNQLFDPRFFWGSPLPHVGLTLDNLKNLTFEVAAGLEKEIDGDESKDYSFSSRVMYDFSVLNGTRAVLSFLGQKSGPRKMGIGLLNFAPNRSLFHLEWARYRSAPSGEEEPDRRLLRIAYQDPPRAKAQTYVLYDDVNFQHRLLVVGSKLSFNTQFNTNLAIAYKKDETGMKRHRWYFSGGLGFQL